MCAQCPARYQPAAQAARSPSNVRQHKASMNFPESLFWVAFAAIAGYFLFNVIRRGGFKAAMFNAEIKSTLGEVHSTALVLGSQSLKVHRLRKDGQDLVGIELVSKSIGSYQMVPITLSAEAARSLATLLQQAAQKTP